ncbi:L-threonine ammonia-lyase [Planktotalea frisia]|jgi:threonine dehydratase|uniref:L-threonine dehydratase n=2 Tax=Planktotalea frisia TaxID=696762 RepID=A0A1L9P0B4_9RHOB|nr:threonine ammonia-lyase IlvA [Planktotalea frisia]OJI94967.1 L-threonine dehydratase biosynthetic IlvA [Planktotalea frisia]PZX18025.1 L-threonine ammonia-lyase [Planktotalea frisia]
MTSFQDRAILAEHAIRAVLPPTPLQRNVHLSEKYDAEVWLKREDLSPVRSYKLRGAFNAMRKVISNDPDKRNFVCASAGNHAQGVAYMCKHFDVNGTIFMPVTTPQQKIEKTRIFGGDTIEIKLIGDYFDDTLRAAQSHCESVKGHFLSPFDDDDVIEGQATVAVEIEAQLGEMPDRIVLPVGGGGLSAGVRGYIGARSEMTFVEPLGGACLFAALSAQEPVDLPRVDTFADGAAVGRIGARTFQILSDVPLSNTLQIHEDRLCITMLEMLNIEGIVLEPAGALALDALSDLKEQIKGKKIVCIASGGNFDFERLPEVKERAQRFAGLKKYFVLRMPQRPGALKEFLSILGPEDDISRFEYLKKSARNFGSILIGLETKKAENFSLLLAKLTDAGFAYTDITDDEILAQFLI